MSWVWSFSQRICKEQKKSQHIFLWLNTVFFGVIGFLVWLVLRNLNLNNWDWAVVFAGYPAFFIGILGGILYLYKL